MSAEILKSCDYLWKTYLVGYYPGILPNNAADSQITQTSYVNAPLYYMIKTLYVKIGTHTIFEISGLMMLVMCELNGLIKDLAEIIGFNFTKNQLIADSRRNRILLAPLAGLPINEGTDTAFTPGLFFLKQIKFKKNSRFNYFPPNQYCLQYKIIR